MSSVIAFLGDNSVPYDEVEALEFLQKKDPELLLPDESIIMAFQDRGGHGRDSSYFTSSRILIRDKKGLGKRVKYISVPYKSIKAFSVETAGTLDADVELKLYGSGGIGKIGFDFVTGAVDILAINRFLTQMMFEDVIKDGMATVMPETDNTSTGFWSKIGLSDNADQVDASYVKENYQDLLLDDEDVELAFQCGRDTDILTTKRMVKVNVKGLTGSKIEFLSIRWECIKAFSLETAGSYFDRDCDIMIFTNMGYDLTRIEMDLRKGTIDIYAVQKYFADKLLGVSDEDSGVTLPSGTFESNPADTFFSWLGDDNKAIDPKEMDEQYHSEPPLLQATEVVEMAFKGRRDIILFTNKRLVIVDFKGWSGKKVEYVTIPWKTVQSFGVCSAGSFLDKDSEFFIWTDINDVFFPAKLNEDDPPPPPIPRMSFLEFDFKKDAVDLMAVQRYLSERCIRTDNSELFEVQEFAGSSSSSFGNFLSWLGNDHQEIDPVKLNEQLTTEAPVLVADENVIMGFKAGRDSTVFTNKRILTINVKGMTGKKIEWRSIPYTSVRAFAGESAGSFDLDAELKLYCRTYWNHDSVYPGSKDKIDFKKGKADIIAIQSLLAHFVIGSTDGFSTNLNVDSSHDADTSAFEGFTTWIMDDAKAIDAKHVDQMLHSTPSILLNDEHVDNAYKVGRDMIIFTTKRILSIDRQGLTGKKIEYTTYPIRYCTGYKAKSPGMIAMFKPAEITVYTEIPGKSTFSQDIKDGADEMWKVNTMLGKKIVLRN